MHFLEYFALEYFGVLLDMVLLEKMYIIMFVR